MKRLGYFDRSARISGRPAIPPFQGGGRVLYGLLWVSYCLTLWQVVKRTNDLPLISKHKT